MTHEEFKIIASSLPNQPGIYKYLNDQGKILYIGKAKDIRKRVSSYFNKHQDGKTFELVRQAHHIEYTIVPSEKDALLLENTLIKKNQPPFNIQLKDDKSYPYIVIKNERFPRVFITRRKFADGSDYIGPFTSLTQLKWLFDFIKDHFKIRTCPYRLSDSNIRNKKFKVCLAFHLKQCLGPCEGLQSEERYQEQIKQIKNLLQGRLSVVIDYFKSNMLHHAEQLEFEKAQSYKQAIEKIKGYQSTSVVVSKKNINADVVYLRIIDNKAFVSYLLVQEGLIVQTHSKVYDCLLPIVEEALTQSLSYFREKFDSHSKEIIVASAIDYPLEDDIKVTVPPPTNSPTKKLLDLAEKNVLYLVAHYENRKRLHLEKSDNQDTLLKQLQIDLKLPDLPRHIECFDNSNFHGSYPVGAMVCFKDGKPDKKNYRHFHIKTIVGSNDFGSMKEIVKRRYERLTNEQQDLPNLIIVDGGKGQVSSAMEGLNMLSIKKMPVLIGLAKQQEEIYFPNHSMPLVLPLNSSSLLLLRRIRDEVHRFGIQFHRSLRQKASVPNELTEIKGIGQQIASVLLKHFKSVPAIKKSSLAELQKLVGDKKGSIVYDYFQPKQDEATP
ncbi:MAG: excinuclease ABC subunit UvrC [Limnohabitans sp.]|nr:excinuclease ABC subunit UvrC [Limnohabitans sp.]